MSDANFAISAETLRNITLDDLAALATSRLVYWAADGENLSNSPGGRIGAIIQTGIVYSYNPNKQAASIMPADDAIVTSDGRVYEAAGVTNLRVVESVRSSTVTAAPSDARVGDSYIIPENATGAWAAFPKHIAMMTRRGWMYIEPRVGMWIMDESTNYRWEYRNDATWHQGVNATHIDDDAILRTSLTFPMGATVIEVGRNDPPDAPFNHMTYIVGSNPTGAWSTFPNLYVYYFNGTWRRHHRAYEGARVYNLADKFTYEWNGTAWLPVDKSPLLESYVGDMIVSPATSVTVTTAALGTKEAWIIGGDNFFPRVVSANDSARLQIIDAGSLVAKVKAEAGVVTTNKPNLNYNMELGLLVGSETDPSLSLQLFEDQSVVSSGTVATNTLTVNAGAAVTRRLNGVAGDMVRLALIIEPPTTRAANQLAADDVVRDTAAGSLTVDLEISYQMFRNTF